MIISRVHCSDSDYLQSGHALHVTWFGLLHGGHTLHKLGRTTALRTFTKLPSKQCRPVGQFGEKKQKTGLLGKVQTDKLSPPKTGPETSRGLLGVGVAGTGKGRF